MPPANRIATHMANKYLGSDATTDRLSLQHVYLDITIPNTPDYAMQSDRNLIPEMRASKRSMPDAPAPPDPKRPRSQQDRPEDSHNMLVGMYVQDTVKGLHDWYRPAIKSAEMEAALPRRPIFFDQTYTAEDEARLQDEWEQDPLRDFRLTTVPDPDLSMLNLYRLCGRLCPGTFPEQIISERYDLCFEQEPEVAPVIGNAGLVVDPRWSARFCSALLKLLPHPCFEDVASMVVCIQYAVICRTGKQRKVPWPRYSTQDFFINEFMDTYNKPGYGDLSIVDIHSEVRRQGGSHMMSRLFLELERIAFKEDTITRSSDACNVRVVDLQNLLDALDSLTHRGIPCFLPSAVLDALTKTARTGRDAPDNADLARHREKVILDVRRWQLKHQKTVSLQRLGSTRPVPRPITRRYKNPHIAHETDRLPSMPSNEAQEPANVPNLKFEDTTSTAVPAGHALQTHPIIRRYLL